jgi:hypothetical protein
MKTKLLKKLRTKYVVLSQPSINQYTIISPCRVESYSNKESAMNQLRSDVLWYARSVYGSYAKTVKIKL